MSYNFPNPNEKVKDVSIFNSKLVVDLVDGRSIATPLSWYPRLLKATSEQLSNWELCGAGFGIHWPGIDEDLSISGMLNGRKAPDGK